MLNLSLLKKRVDKVKSDVSNALVSKKNKKLSESKQDDDPFSIPFINTTNKNKVVSSNSNDDDSDNNGNKSKDSKGFKSPLKHLEQKIEIEKKSALKQSENVKLDHFMNLRNNIKSGNYIIKIHIIEVRNLLGIDFGGISDPMVEVEIFEKKKHTSIKKKTFSCIFDELLEFQFNNLEVDQIENASIIIRVYDANLVLRNALIGLYEFDLSTIYYQPKHELYKVWLALSDPYSTRKNSDGVQGYLKTSINVMGPGDKFPIRSTEDTNTEDNDAIANVLMPPGVHDVKSLLKIYPLYTEHLPKMDDQLIDKDHDCDPYVQVEFSGVSCKTQVYKIDKNQKSGRHCEFKEVISIPVSSNVMSSKLRFSMYDWDAIGSSDRISTVSVDYKGFNKNYKDHMKGSGKKGFLVPRWINLYGALPGKQNGEYVRKMNKSYVPGCYYRGRVLVRMDLEEKEGAVVSVKKLKKNVYKLPPTKEYTIQADIYQGNNMSKGSFQIGLACGNDTFYTSIQKSNEGIIQWYEQLAGHKKLDIKVELPEDTSQCPDIFIYLIKDKKHIAFSRLKFDEQLKKTGNEAPSWIQLEGCKGPDNNQIPGIVLSNINISCGGAKNIARPFKLDKGEQKGMSVILDKPQRCEYQLRVYFFKGIDLPNMDIGSLTDAYCIVKCNDKVMNTKIVEDSLYPEWFECMSTSVQLMDPIGYSAPVEVFVFDDDFGKPDDCVGRFTVPVTDILKFSKGPRLNKDGKLVNEIEYSMPPKPQYFNLKDYSGNPLEGAKILASFELLPTKKAANIPLPRMEFNKAKLTLEILTLGLRDISSVIGTRKPLVQYMIANQGLENSVDTKSSSKPSPTNPNFLQISRIPLSAIKYRKFIPTLEITVRDSLFGGMIKRRLGSGSLILADLFDANQQKEDENELLQDLEEKENNDEKTDVEIEIVNLDRDVKQVKNIYTEFSRVDVKEAEEIRLSGKKDVEFEEKYFLPQSMSGRKSIQEFENLISNPFLSIPLYTGVKDGFIGKHRTIGTLKVIANIKELNEKKLDSYKDLLRPSSVSVRIYITRAMNLSPKDMNGLADPYLVVTLGKDKRSTRKRYCKNTLNPNFFEYFEFKTTLPGVATCKIDLYDWDGILDDHIGSTTIDLEKRYFSKKWKQSTSHNSDNKKVITPIETRQLYVPTSSISQGVLECFVDIIPQNKAQVAKPVSIAPPKKKEYEVRVVVWDCDDVTIKDIITDQNDLYITGVLSTGQRDLNIQRTDCHYRSKKGKGEFNYRMKFPVTLPCKIVPRLKLAIWDRDLLSANDAICEETIHLKDLCEEVMKTQGRCRLFVNGKEKIQLKNLKHPNFGNNNGSMRISIEIVPKKLSEKLDNGVGRTEPNAFPYLKKPTSRIKLSLFKPFHSLKEILGDRLYLKMCGLFLCVFVIFVLVYTIPGILSNIIVK